MIENKVYKILIIVVVVCLSFIFAIMVLNVMSKDDFSDTNFSEADFPLEIDLLNTVFNVGDKVTGTATITNKSGRTVEISSNGYTPCAYLHYATTDNYHADIDNIHFTVLKAGDKITTVFSQEVDEAGTYVLYLHYCIEVNRCVRLYSELEDVIIEVR